MFTNAGFISYLTYSDRKCPNYGPSKGKTGNPSQSVHSKEYQSTSWMIKNLSELLQNFKVSCKLKNYKNKLFKKSEMSVS